ncbi:MAG: hypothetical protein KC615_12300 [Anaerolineae bacterium]|nr:hypothetical protein [Anaerolineae bacterium]
MHGSIDEAFNEYLGKQISQEAFFTFWIIQSIESDCETQLTEEETKTIRQQVQEALKAQEEKGTSTLELNIQIDSEIDCNFKIPQFTTDNYLEFRQIQTREAYRKGTDALAKTYRMVIDEKRAALLEHIDQGYSGFCGRLNAIWGEALNSLAVLVHTSQAFGDEFNQSHQSEAEANDDVVFEVLRRLHARACLIGQEVNTLLANGFADGAVARWRTLYEVCVVAHYIKDHGKECAKRFILYQAIDTYKELQRHHEHSDINYWSKKEQEAFNSDFEKYAEIKESLVEEFGNEFHKDYGWTVESKDGRALRFNEIEEQCELQRFRPTYKVASGYVHSSSAAVYNPIGYEYPYQNVLLAGPSLFGLYTPGVYTAQSLGHISSLLLSHITDLYSVAQLKCVKELRDEVYEAFDKCDQSMEELRQDNDRDVDNTDESES